ncbi:hypothetical protein Zmor_021632 [Zophobas morio]|uniref:RNase H type-1 domain-containing protein n=1 Tax=Zophobas morio TaxID=2755281 RepID=A0AA38I8I1_9CUCU|nr:hypothetical protein Zmor_021632 [Zophobas morio]
MIPRLPLTILVDIPDSFIMYTDGSKTTEGVGVAYAIPSGEQLYRLPATSSILTAELVAISATVQDDSLRITPHHNIVICTDSMNSLRRCIQPAFYYNKSTTNLLSSTKPAKTSISFRLHLIKILMVTIKPMQLLNLQSPIQPLH